MLTKQINEQGDIEINCNLMINIIFDLMLGNSVSDENFQILSKFVNNYSCSITSSNYYKLPKKLHLMSGRLPFFRYQTMSYIQSVMLIPHHGSIFDFYNKNKNQKKKKKKKKNSEQINTLQWCLDVINALDIMNNPGNKDIIENILFKYDLIKNDDRKKILTFINDEIISRNCKEIIDEDETLKEDIEDDQNSDSDNHKIDEKNQHKKIKDILNWFARPKIFKGISIT